MASNWCLVDDEADGALRTARVDGFGLGGYAPAFKPGQRSGSRIHGPYDPERGTLRPRPSLLDPWRARAITWAMDRAPAALPVTPTRHCASGLGIATVWTASGMRSIRSSSSLFDWGQDRPPRHEYHKQRDLRSVVKSGYDDAASRYPRRDPAGRMPQSPNWRSLRIWSISG